MDATFLGADNDPQRSSGVSKMDGEDPPSQDREESMVSLIYLSMSNLRVILIFCNLTLA